MSSVDEVAAAIRSGGLAVIPTDTVYGLACSPYREAPVRALSELKGRRPAQPVALVAATVDMLLMCVPELRGRAGILARALLPGPYTLVLPNPAHRFPWLSGDRLDAIGVRVPDLAGPGRELLDAVGAGFNVQFRTSARSSLIPRAVPTVGGFMPRRGRWGR